MTIPALGHAMGVEYSETAHPHYKYTYCTRCSSKWYIGGQKAREHGRLEDGKCPNCGPHVFAPRVIDNPEAAHPHYRTYECFCGTTKIDTWFDPSCTGCTGPVYYSTDSTDSSAVLLYLDGDQGMGIPVAVRVDFNTYSNIQYCSPASAVTVIPTSNIVFYVKSVNAGTSITHLSVPAAPISIDIYPSIVYKDSSNVSIATQTLSYTDPQTDHCSSLMNAFFGSQYPSTSTVQSVVLAETSGHLAYGHSTISLVTP